jgi:Protein of unknown function (DUF2934)
LEKIIMARVKGSSKKAANGNGDARTNGNHTAEVKQAPVSALQTSSAADSNATKASAPRPPSTNTSVYPSVSEEQIRRRAYELYVQRGGQGGSHVDDWFRAERELRGRR